MEIGTLFLKSNSTGIITFSELDWITTHQSNFTRLEESIAIKLGRMLMMQSYQYTKSLVTLLMLIMLFKNPRSQIFMLFLLVKI